MEPGAGGYQYRTMREIGKDERPRERLLRHGADVLGDGELIAIILGSGMAGENVLDLARRILDDSGGLDGMVRADAKALQQTRGLGPAKAAQLLAALELGRRAGQVDPHRRPLLQSPEQVYGLMGPRLSGRTREEVYVLALDTRMRLLGAPRAVVGGVNAVRVSPAEVFREAIVLQAPNVVLVHNHPSGDPTPSPEDVAATKMLHNAGKLLDIHVQDHVVIGQGRFVSMQRSGLVFNESKHG
ncbi:MAG: DNA repair protein RadC [Dehalococcoidia bacterium]|nr:DNA repair protein RadC [Dehalococcoidia bacterium]